MKWLSDPTRRFVERPHYSEAEIYQRVEALLRSSLGESARFPLSDNALDLVVDSITGHYDPMADLHTHLGDDVEGVTLFRPGHKPRVKISAHLLNQSYRRRRRMTIAHEIGHVLLHCDLYTESRAIDLFSDSSLRGRVYCKQATMLPGVDWLEWQASFAGGCLLMPSAVVREKMTEIRANLVDHPLYLDDKETAKVVVHIADAFDVSYEAAKVRLLQTGFIEHNREVQRLPLWSFSRTES